MYDAYEALPVLEKLPLQIDSIAAYDDLLLVGTHQGHLLMYSVLQGTDSTSNSKCEVHLLRSNKYFAKKPIVQLAVVPEHQILISLSDNIVSVHDLTVFNFPVITYLNKSKGATYFALDVKRQTSLTGEIAVTVRLCVVVKRKLQLYYWKNREFREFGPDLSVPDVPRTVGWCRETLCVGFKGEYCLLKLDGEQKDLFPTGKQPEPLVCSLQGEKFALGRDDQTILVDIEGNPSTKYTLTWSETPIFLVEDSPYMLGVLPSCIEVRAMEPRLLVQRLELPRARLLSPVVSKHGQIYAASASHIWCLHLVPAHQQLAPLLEDKHFQLAIQLASMSEEPEDIRTQQVQHIQALYAFDLFGKHQFEDSLQLFLKLNTDPSYVIGLFPDLLPVVFRRQLEYPETVPILQGRDLEQAVLALIKYLTEVRNNLMSQNLKSSSTTAVIDVPSTLRSRRQLLQIVDTTLLKCYLLTNDALVASLLRLRDNNCHLEESERALKRHHKHAELIILYQTRGLHRQALELLKKHATSTEEIGSSLANHERTVQYLQHLGPEHVDLIFDFSSWVINFYPEDGLKIFTEDIHEIEELPRAKVYDFLYKNHRTLALPYLEHVVYVWKDNNALFHNGLAVQYKDRFLQLSKQLQESGPSPVLQNEYQELKSKLREFLTASEHCTPEGILVQFPYDCLFEERAVLLGKLGRHEQALSIYTNILNNIPEALAYCNLCYQSDSPSSKEVYFYLLKLLLQPNGGAKIPGLAYPADADRQPDINTALETLGQYPSRIDPIKTLQILPACIPLQQLERFLHRSVQSCAADRRQLQLLRGLLYAEHLQVHEQRIEYQNQRIVITESNICHVCKKRFGNQSAFVRCPSGDIVHYSCQEKIAS